jgi:hypothetical protein
MSNFFYICFSLFLISCKPQNSETKKNTFEFKDSVSIVKPYITDYNEGYSNYLDSISKELLKLQSKDKLTSLDTLKYKFYLEDVGTEGNEGIAYYLDNRLKKANIEIYTSMWKYVIQYIFYETKIDVIESTYNISNGVINNLEMIKKITYIIDLSGKIEGDTIKDRIDIFEEFKLVVPFELK